MYTTFSTQKTGDTTNDIWIGADGNFVMSDGKAAVGNAAVNAARTQLGELPLAWERGVPYLQTIFHKNGMLNVFLSYLTSELSKVEGIRSVSSLEHKVVENVLLWEAHLKTDEGDTIING